MEEKKEKWQRITVEILKVLEKNGCTAAEALDLLNFTKDTVLLIAKVSADWPKE